MRLSKAAALVLSVFLAACALRPEWQRLAREGGLESQWMDAGQFRLRILKNGIPGEHLRIYIEGDGTPWIREDRVSVDPTPANPVLLRLIHDADYPAVYLGRPCYFGTSTSQACNERWWTFERYNKAVVDGMCEAANEIARQAGSVELIGFSGGAAITIRMTGCTDKLTRLTTIAGNLDPAAWTTHHNYSALIDDMSIDGLPPSGVAEVHWQCRNDKNIPPGITDAYFEKRPTAVRYIVENCTHAGGWEQFWPGITSGTLLK